jgi:hypothetical protein
MSAMARPDKYDPLSQRRFSTVHNKTRKSMKFGGNAQFYNCRVDKVTVKGSVDATLVTSNEFKVGDVSSFKDSRIGTLYVNNKSKDLTVVLNGCEVREVIFKYPKNRGMVLISGSALPNVVGGRTIMLRSGSTESSTESKPRAPMLGTASTIRADSSYRGSTIPAGSRGSLGGDYSLRGEEERRAMLAERWRAVALMQRQTERQEAETEAWLLQTRQQTEHMQAETAEIRRQTALARQRREAEAGAAEEAEDFGSFLKPSDPSLTGAMPRVAEAAADAAEQPLRPARDASELPRSRAVGADAAARLEAEQMWVRDARGRGGVFARVGPAGGGAAAGGGGGGGGARGRGRFKCDLCGIKIHNQQSLNMHISLRHPKCPRCPAHAQRFESDGALNAHLRDVHPRSWIF